jgi:2-iminobutanoate/2-iminopropanoate deaminase
MTGDRARVAALAGLTGLILGIVVTLASQGGVPALQSGEGRKVIRPEKAPNTGLPFSPGILVGSTLYLAGHLGRDPVTALVPGGIEAETRQVLANVREVLRTAGMDFKDVASVTAYITRFDDFAKFNAVYSEFFPNDPPARVELQMIAVKP